MKRILLSLLMALPLFTKAQVGVYQADMVADMVGCNTHFSWPGAYSDSFTTLKSRLQELGVRHIRDINMGSDTAFNDRINQLAGAGIKSDIICEPWWTWPENLAYFKTIRYLPNAPVEFIEYPNELFDYPGITASKCITDYTGFYNTYRNDTATAGIPLFGPSFSDNAYGPGQFIDSGGYDMTDKMDYGNLHCYPGGTYVEGPEGGGNGISLDADIDEYHLINQGNKPLAATETGYQRPDNGQWGVTDSVAAKYEPRVLMWYLKKGLRYAYRYQLIDDNAGHAGAPNYYGILDSNCAGRPGFYAIKNTIKLFSDPGPMFTPGTLAYTLSGDTAGAHLQSMLFQKRNGNFLLVLWQAVSSGTCNASPEDFNTLPVALKVTVSGVGGGTAMGYTPSFDSSAVASFDSIDTMAINVSDHVYVLEIIPATTQRNAIRVFPNPATTQLNIAAAENITNIVITNLFGQTVYSSQLAVGSLQAGVDLSALPGGVYFLRVNPSAGSGQVFVRKFVKE